jgi:hypothetical protein
MSRFEQWLLVFVVVAVFDWKCVFVVIGAAICAFIEGKIIDWWRWRRLEKLMK